MRRTDVIVDSRIPGRRHRGELRPIGPILERTVARLRERPLTAAERQRRAA